MSLRVGVVHAADRREGSRTASRRLRRLGVLAIIAVMASVIGGDYVTLARDRTARQYTARAAANGSRRGRPRKFGRPSRAVTLTLPPAGAGDFDRVVVLETAGR